MTNSGRKKSRGVMLNGRSAGLHFWRDEHKADGGKRYLRRRAKARECRQWLKDLAA